MLIIRLRCYSRWGSGAGEPLSCAGGWGRLFKSFYEIFLSGSLRKSLIFIIFAKFLEPKMASIGVDGCLSVV